MDEYQAAETVVDAPVDAEQSEVSSSNDTHAETTPEGSNTVVTEAVDAPKPENYGEAIKREVERREAQLRKQYEEQYSSVTKHSEQLKRAARLNGWGDNIDGYIDRLNEIEQQQQIEQEAQRMGIDPETYSQYFAPVNDELSQLRNEVQSFRQQQTEAQRQQQETEQWQALYKEFPELAESSKVVNEGKQPDWYSQEMQDYIGMGYQPLHAYKLANQEAIVRKKEQEVLARITGRDQTQVLPSVDSPNNLQLDPSNMSFAEIQSISERVRRGERITF